MPLTRIVPRVARFVAWTPLALCLAAIALILGWILRPARLDEPGEGLAGAVLTSVALLLAASAFPARGRTGMAPCLARPPQASPRLQLSIAA